MNIVISDPKTGKAYSKKTEQPIFLGKKVGEEVSLDAIGLSGFKAKIMGGSDKQGFPMKSTLPGIARRKILISKGTGFKPTLKGERKRISMRGNVISEEISQLNVAITKKGDANIEMVLGKKKEEKEDAKGEKEDAKEEKEEAPKTEKKAVKEKKAEGETAEKTEKKAVGETAKPVKKTKEEKK